MKSILYIAVILFVFSSCIETTRQKRENANQTQFVEDGLLGHIIYSDSVLLSNSEFNELTSIVKTIDKKWIVDAISIDSLSIVKRFKRSTGHIYTYDSICVYRCISITVRDKEKKNYMRFSFPYSNNKVLIQDGDRYIKPDIYTNECTGNYSRLRSFLLIKK